MAIDSGILAYDDTVPDEVRRLRLNPGDLLIVRVTDLVPRQMQEYQQYLEAVFPDNPVHVIHADEILVANPDSDDA